MRWYDYGSRKAAKNRVFTGKSSFRKLWEALDNGYSNGYSRIMKQATREVGTMTTSKVAAKCTSVTPVTRKDAKGQPLRYGICPECGGYLAILNSGFFRTHKPVMKPGNPQIAINIANAEAGK